MFNIAKQIIQKLEYKLALRLDLKNTLMSQLELPTSVGQRLALGDIQPSNKENVLKIDDIYENVVGSHGLWQCCIVLMVCLSTSSSITFPIFANAVPKYRCRLDNSTEELFKKVEFDVIPSDISNTSRRLLNFIEVSSLVGPWPLYTTDESVYNGIYGCQFFKRNYSIEHIQAGLLNYSRIHNDNDTEMCSDGYIYEPWSHQFPDTIVEEWDLVCGDAWKVPFSTSIYMFGMMVGFMLGGFMGDRLGRMKTVYISSLLEFSFGIAVSFSHSYTTYTLFRALLAASCTTKVTSISVLLVEMTNARYRSVFSAGWSIYINFLSRCLTAILAMYLPSWRHLHLVIMVPSYIGVLVLLFLPESPRWLVSRGNYKQAANVLFQAYRMNHYFGKGSSQLPSKVQFLELISYEWKEGNMPPTKSKRNLFSYCKPSCKVGFIYAFFLELVKPYRTRALAKVSVLSTSVFACQLCCFFGLLYYARIIRGSVYAVSIVNCVTALPATLISTIVYKRTRSRRRPLIILYALSCLTLLIGGLYTTIAQPESELALIICCNVALVLLGASFNMIFIYVPELFPSVLRTQGLGYAAGLGRVGSIVCSFINQLDLDVRHGLPIIIYGAVLLLQLIFVCSVPDSTGENLEDRIKSKTKSEIDCEI